jgi:4a-hydroxytetrahydrobiopterin dehydratase
MPAVPLSADQLQQLPTALPHWPLINGKLQRELRFANFVEAFAFMTKVALIAEAMGHHPEWSNVWNRVTIALTTHDTGGLSDLDLELARRIDGLLG